MSHAQDERAQLRKYVSDWARLEMGRSKLSRLQVQNTMRRSGGWLNNRLHGATVTFKPGELREFAEILRVTVPADVQQAAEAVRKVKSRATRLAKLPKLTDEALGGAGSAAAEVALVLEAASTGRQQRERDLSWTSRRFGLNGHPETLEEIGASSGVTREYVRQVERKVLKLASVVTAGCRFPMLASIHQQVIESAGLPMQAIENELRPFLGQIPLSEAIRFLEQVQPPDQRVTANRAVIYKLDRRRHGAAAIRVVAASDDDLRFTSQVSSAARKIVSYAGAALVNDIRALVETSRKRPVALRDLVRTLGVLPGIQWLDEHHRWCWFDAPESPLLRRTAQILAAARAPVDIETLYAGLVREGRRTVSGHVCDPVPPAHVVHAILLRHPDYRRTSGNAFAYTGPHVPPDDTNVQAILTRLDELGGAATRAELLALEKHPERPVNRQSCGVYLYLCGCIERLGPGAWAIRGSPGAVRRVDAAARAWSTNCISDARALHCETTASAGSPPNTAWAKSLASRSCTSSCDSASNAAVSWIEPSTIEPFSGTWPSRM